MNESTDFEVGDKAIYEPVMLDRIQPTIIAGKAIKPGRMVEITKTNFDPLHKFVFIKDRQGNAQSVYTSSVRRP